MLSDVGKFNKAIRVILHGHGPVTERPATDLYKSGIDAVDWGTDPVRCW